MSTIKFLLDPLGNLVMLSSLVIAMSDELKFKDLESTINKPAYIIQLKKETIYFSRPIDKGGILMIKTITKSEYYEAEKIVKNPSMEFISGVLKMGGRLFTF